MHTNALQINSLQYTSEIHLTIGIPRNVNKKTNGEIICAGRKGGVSVQRS